MPLRKRDTAILTLLYGCGLRLSEALGLTRAEAPVGEMVAITGKGSKQRFLPVLPAVLDHTGASPSKSSNIFVGWQL